MQLNIASPTEKEELQIAWLECETTQGNVIILSGHAPVIMTLRPMSAILYRLKSGKEESRKIINGVIHVTRNTITLLLTN